MEDSVAFEADRTGDCVMDVILPNGHKRNNVHVHVGTETLAKQIRETIIEDYHNTNEFETILFLVQPNGTEKMVQDDEMVTHDDLTEAKSLKLKYLSSATMVACTTASGVQIGMGIVSGDPGHAEVINIEVLVKYPNKEEKFRQMWMMNEPSSDMKIHLMKMEGLEHPPYTPFENWEMVLHFSEKPPKIILDNTTLNFYLHDMAEAQYIEIRQKEEGDKLQEFSSGGKHSAISK